MRRQVHNSYRLGFITLFVFIVIAECLYYNAEILDNINRMECAPREMAIHIK